MTNNPTIDGVSRELLERIVASGGYVPRRAELRALLDAPDICPTCDSRGGRPDCKPEPEPAVERQEPYGFASVLIDSFRFAIDNGKQPTFSKGDLLWLIDQLSKAQAGAAALQSTIAQLQARIADHEQAMESLKDPESVLVNMLRGSIAKLSVRSFAKTHGEVINTDEAQLLEISRLRERIAELESGMGEPVAWMCISRDGYAQRCTKTDPEGFPVYRAPPAPVAVVLPEREMFHGEMDNQEIDFNRGWNACLDATAALNGPAK